MCRNAAATRVDHAQTALLDDAFDNRTVVTAPIPSSSRQHTTPCLPVIAKKSNNITSQTQFAYLTGDLGKGLGQLGYKQFEVIRDEARLNVEF